MKPLLIACAYLFAGSHRPAPQPQADNSTHATPAPPGLIDHLVANAQLYSATLPSIGANEAIVSEGSYLIFHRRVEAKAVFRVVRDPKDGALEESRQITEIDGKPVEPGRHAALPWTLLGGFEKFQQLFFTPSHTPCFTFTLLPQPGPGATQQIAVAELPPALRTPACNQAPRGYTGLIRVDPATGQIVYLERSVPEDVAVPSHLAPFASVEIGPVRIGEQTFWLPSVIIGTFVSGKTHGRFEARYFDYHRYTGSITILPGVNPVEPDPPAAKTDLAPPFSRRLR